MHLLWDYKDYSILILSVSLLLHVTTAQSPQYVATLTDLTWLDVSYANLTSVLQT